MTSPEGRLPVLEVPTRFGAVPIWGHFGRFDPARPLLLVIRGAFPDPWLMWRLPDHLPEWDVVLAHLPGMHSPHLSETSVEAFAAAFDELLETRFTSRRVVRLGFSVGGLVAMAMRAGEGLVVVDPPLRTGDLWPLIPRLRAELARTQDPRLAEWIWNIFGVSASQVKGRDYTPMLDALPAGAVMVVAGEPLEPERQLQRLPGLVTAADRQRMAAIPGLWTVVAAGIGHNVSRDAPQIILDAIDAAAEHAGPEQGNDAAVGS